MCMYIGIVFKCITHTTSIYPLFITIDVDALVNYSNSKMQKLSKHCMFIHQTSLITILRNQHRSDKSRVSTNVSDNLF